METTWKYKKIYSFKIFLVFLELGRSVAEISIQHICNDLGMILKNLFKIFPSLTLELVVGSPSEHIRLFLDQDFVLLEHLFEVRNHSEWLVLLFCNQALDERLRFISNHTTSSCSKSCPVKLMNRGTEAKLSEFDSSLKNIDALNYKRLTLFCLASDHTAQQYQPSTRLESYPTICHPPSCPAILKFLSCFGSLSSKMWRLFSWQLLVLGCWWSNLQESSGSI